MTIDEAIDKFLADLALGQAQQFPLWRS